jgi:serine/threonine-protein kinase
MPDETDDTLPEGALSVSRSAVQAGFGSVQIGTVVADSYRVIGRLGEGAMGVVLLARDERLERPVAIKLVRPEMLRSETAQQQFRAEARAMARVSHPNVVTIFASGDHDGMPYFVMEYIPGMDLETWTAALGGPPVPVDVGVAVVREICAGVRAIHRAGAVHGDLKPTNVLVGEDNRVVVSDLGLARFLGETSVGSRAEVVGTPAYMAPEILEMRAPPPELAPRSDVYSLAVLAYELLTGALPFDAPDLVSLLNKHATVPPPPPSSVSELSGAFDDVLLAALTKDPALRTESVEHFADALDDAVANTRRSSSAPTIVLLDDDPDFLDFAAAALEEGLPGASISRFTRHEPALEAIAAGASAAVIDLSMPDVNGLEVLAAIRERERGRHVPVAVVTAVGGAKDWKVLSTLGAEAFLAKPVSPSELVRTVRQLVGRSSLRPPGT